MASTADAIAFPCPSPQSPAAKPRAKPAARTANGPTQPPPAPSAAKATAGTPRTVNPARISERRTPALLCTCAVLELILRESIDVPLVLVGVLQGARDVEHRQHHEDKRLEQRDQDLQRIEKADREGDHNEPPE